MTVPSASSEQRTREIEEAAMERFWAKVDRGSDTECWPWQAAQFRARVARAEREADKLRDALRTIIAKATTEADVTTWRGDIAVVARAALGAEHGE